MLRAGTPLANILSNHLSSVWESLADASVEDLPAINRTLVGAVAGAFCQGPVREDAAMPFEDAARDAVRAFIVHNLDDPGLGPARLCRRFGLSRTRLYELFKPIGGISAYVQARRTARLRALLGRPENRMRSVGHLAFQAGFAAESHAIRLYKRQFGETPGQHRRNLQDPTRPQPASAGGFHGWIDDINR